MQSDGDDIRLWIDEDRLGEFAMDLLTISEDVSDLFSSVDEKMSNLKSCYDSKQYENLMSSYRMFRKNYSIVKHNIVSYSDDLIAVINKVRAGDKDIAFLISQITDEAKRQANKIENL